MLLGATYLTANVLIVGRTFITPHKFKHARWSLGRFSRPLTFIAMIWNLYLACVLFSPLFFPVTAETFNCTNSYFRTGLVSSSLAYRLPRHIRSNHPLWVPFVVADAGGEMAPSR